MKTKILVLVTLLTFLSAGCFKKAPIENQKGVGNQTSEQKQDKGQKTLKDLVAQGKKIQCTANFENNGTKSEGIIYSANGKMLAEFNSQIAGKTIKNHILITENQIYNWSDNSNVGFKTNANQQDTTKSTTASEQKADINQTVDYSCADWDFEEAKFEIPKNVSFKDLSSLMSAGKSDGEATDLKSLQCQACDQAPQEQKAACMQALGCK